MRHRVLASMSVVAVVVVSLSAMPVFAQTVPRTAWGQPDLGGIWDFRTITPMQRPRSRAEQEFLTAEEAASLERAAVDRNTDLANRGALRTEATRSVDLGEEGAPGFYNNFWLDGGTRTVGTRRTSLIVDPPNGRMPAVTESSRERGRARREAQRGHVADSWVNRSAFDRCILGFNAGPPITPGGYNQNVQLFQTPDHLVMLTEMVHTVRVIPLDGTPPLVEGLRQLSGDSRGHWEGKTLVVETANFEARRDWRGSTEGMRLVERFTRVDADTLEYEFTVTDPETWDAPWTVNLPMRRNEFQMFEYACHEGNYSMEAMLGGARADERKAIEGGQ